MKTEKPLKGWETMTHIRNTPIKLRAVQLPTPTPFRVNTQSPGPCLPSNHSEDIGFVGKGLFQPRSLGLNPRRLATFGYSHFEGTIWDWYIIVCHLHYMDTCSKRQTNICTRVTRLWEITLCCRVSLSIHTYLLYRVICNKWVKETVQHRYDVILFKYTCLLMLSVHSTDT